jgi:hypothetical protein
VEPGLRPREGNELKVLDEVLSRISGSHRDEVIQRLRKLQIMGLHNTIRQLNIITVIKIEENKMSG